MVDPDQNFLTAGQEAVIRHWSLYGQRGTTPLQRATPFDWDKSEFIAPKAAKWLVPLQPHHLPLLLLGFVPKRAGDNHALIAQTFIDGERIHTHGFMSSSADPKVKASEDKWFVYADGPSFAGDVTINMNRCWTGTKVLELRIAAGKVGYDGSVNGWPYITHIVWESDAQVWQATELEQAKEIAQEVCRWVLNVDFNDQKTSRQPVISHDALEDAVRQLPPTGPTEVYSQRQW